ncbi:MULTISPECIES: hypothetical protein [Amycolatopsis]|uniref:Tail assembly chaperone n=1 Tax=Amycolatopsis albidoflavus TaxID=102226 RepID=A0ABW5I474_9PSEU
MQFSSKHDLPSGGWVELRDPNWLRARDRQALIRKITPDDNDQRDKFTLGFDAINEIAALMITGWSLPYEPEPVVAEDGTETARPWTLPKNDVSILDELLAGDSAALEQLLEPARAVLMPQKPSPDDVDDPASPSGPASE